MPVSTRLAHPRALLLAATLPALVLGAAAVAPPVARAATHVVTIGDGFFSPAQLTVNVGDTVTWVNGDDSPHTATGAIMFDSGNLEPGESFSFTFTAAGEVGYVCSYHDEMTGSIRVVAASAAATPAPQAGSGDAAAPAPTGAAAGETAATGHPDGAHQGDQPNTALAAPAGAAPWLPFVLTGLAVLAGAILLAPADPRPAPQRAATRSRGGWRR